LERLSYSVTPELRQLLIPVTRLSDAKAGSLYGDGTGTNLVGRSANNVFVAIAQHH
jgi:hypothetical protein